MGAVTDIVKRQVPASYRALISTTNSYYGMTELQGIANSIQFRLFATVPGSSNEATLWDYTELELLGTLTSLEFIPAAVDYWGNQLQSQNTSGTNEDVAYFDRRPELWRIYDQLAKKAAVLAADLDVNVVRLKAIVPRVSYGDNGRGILVTSDPARFSRAYRSSTDSLGTEIEVNIVGEE